MIIYIICIILTLTIFLIYEKVRRHSVHTGVGGGGQFATANPASRLWHPATGTIMLWMLSIRCNRSTAAGG
jgi:hypothetical protein